MCFLCNDMNPYVLSISEKHVTFSIDVNQTKIFVATVYANNSHVIQRQL